MTAQTQTFRRKVASFFQSHPGFTTFAHDIYRFTQPKFSVGVVGAVLNEKGQILLAEHVFHAIRWGMPGGWINRNEDPADCAPREIREELSLEVALEGLVMVRLTQRHTRHLDFAYRCRPLGEVGALSSELLGYAWFDLDATPPLVLFQQLVVNKLREERGLRSDNHE